MPRPATMFLGALAALALLAGCGGDDEAGRPTVDEVAAALPDQGLGEEQIACLATSFVDSDISDGGLREIVDSEGLSAASGLSAEDVAAAQEAAAEGLRCSSAAAVDDLTSTTAPAEDPSSTTGPPTTPG